MARLPVGTLVIANPARLQRPPNALYVQRLAGAGGGVVVADEHSAFMNVQLYGGRGTFEYFDEDVLPLRKRNKER